jgi:metal-responsive CopG/Arc/MetJ family transcriptional regulator
MGQFGFRIDDDLVRAFDAYAAERGGRSKVIRGLMVEALSRDGVAAPTPPLKPSRVNGNWEGILVKLDRTDYAALDQHAASLGMSRGQWIASLVKRRLNGRRQYNPIDRKRLGAIFQDLRKIEGHLGRAGQAVREAVELGRSLEQPLALLTQFESRIARISHALHEAFLGNDRYWDDLAVTPQTDSTYPLLPEADQHLSENRSALSEDR